MRILFARHACAGLALALLAPAPASAQSIDPCLVGEWEVTEAALVRREVRGAGGEGARVEFRADGTQRVDYATSRIWSTPDGSATVQFFGRARARIAAANGVAAIRAIELAEVTRRLAWHSIGREETKPLRGLGPAGLGSTAAENGYACAGDTLAYRASSADDGTPTHILKLARIKASAPPPDVAITGKTWLTVTELKNRPQDLGGIWNMAGDSPESTGLRWLDTRQPGRIAIGPLEARGTDIASIRMSPAKPANRWVGQVYVCPRRKECANLCRWVAGSMRLDAAGLALDGTWHDKKAKADCSGHEDVPDSGTFRLERLVGAAVVPVAAGKYLVLAGAPGVGPQKAQFKAAVRVQARYAEVAGAVPVALADRGTLTLKDAAAGQYEFLAERPGRYELRFELRDPDGTAYHVDRIRLDIPAIPGLPR